MNARAALPSLLLTLALMFGAATSFALDTDGNQLDDVWEILYFGQTGNSATADPDGDGADNRAECRASTDPNDAQSLFRILATSDLPNERLDWDSRCGKMYRVQYSDDITTGWTDVFDVPGPGGTRVPVRIPGNGGLLCLDLADPARPLFKGGATREVWVGIGNNANVDNFKRDQLGWANSTTPAAFDAPLMAPSGVENTVGLQAPTNERDGYGQRLRGFIEAPESGDYTFYIAGRHQCEFWLSSVPGSRAPGDLVRVLRQTTTSILRPADWTWHVDRSLTDQQASAPVSLQEGELYYFEALHRHWGQEDHLAVGWTRPSQAAGTIEVVPGDFVCPDIDLTGSNAADLFAPDRHFFRVITDGPGDPDAPDTDGDGIDDGTEGMLPGWDPFDPTSADPTNGATPDLDALTAAVNAAAEQVSVVLQDGRATENVGVADNGIPRFRDPARFRLQRVGSLRPLTVFYSLSGGDNINIATGLPMEEETPEAGDYNEEDEGGAPLVGSITFPAGETRMQVVIDAVNDVVHEYPETVSLLVDPHSDYSVDLAAERAEARIYDERNVEENEILFVGFTLPQPGSLQPKGSAICSGKLSAEKDELTLFSSITAGFSAPQSNSHVHKDEGIPGSDPITFSLPPTGEITDLLWPLNDNGSYTPQKMIDSLFNQVNETTTTGESKLYVNWHTANNPAGELYAFLCPATGSVAPPDPADPPPIAFIDPVAQETELRREITRFLNQATFGADPASIDDVYAKVLAEPAQDRMVVYEQWIDEQLDQTVFDQTRMIDYTFASDWQGWVQRGYFDPSFFEVADWGSNGAPQNRNPAEPAINALPLPARWPRLPNFDPEALDYTDPASFPTPNDPFPLSQQFMDSVRRGQDLGLGEEQQRGDRHGYWSAMANAHDQLRQRLAFTWSQILVISANDGEIQRHYYGKARYWDMLAENADDTFREMLEGVTYSPMMGQYLSHLKNTKEADLDGDGQADVFPDENYAREIMQLFSIGLFELHPDGTLVLDPDEGLPKPTYDNTDITELSRVMTGFSYSRAGDNTNWNNPPENNNFTIARGNKYYGARYEYPMKMFGAQHDTGVKTIAGGRVIDNSSLSDDTTIGHADMASAHDWFAGSGAAPYDGHPSTPAFIARRLIQRLVTSNPPRDYIHRVATVFADTGGDLQAVTKAVLLDYHARSPEIIDDSYGRKKPPLIAYLQLLRGLEARTQLPVTELGNGAGDATDYGLRFVQRANYTRDSRFRYGTTDENLTMTPVGAPSVFNFYLPDYAPGGAVAGSSLVAPEFQILNEITVMLLTTRFPNARVGRRSTPV